MYFLFVLWLSKLVALIVSMIDSSRGTNYAGAFALKLMPDFPAHFKNIDYNKVIFISGTNGKSTTTNMIRHTLQSAGHTVASNVEGANMMGGVATTLIKHSTLLGSLNKEFLVLEIDERSFPCIQKVLPGRHLGITNLQKDQAARNGDPDFILQKFRKHISKDMTLYLNNEEPRSSSLSDCADRVRYFSVADNLLTGYRQHFYSVTLPCPKCSHPIVYERFNLANIGPFRCSHCTHSAKKDPDLRIDAVDHEAKELVIGAERWKVPYINSFYVYNYAMCIDICRQLGVSDDRIKTGLMTFKNPASHIFVYNYHGKEVHFLQGKQENPEALQTQLDIIASDKRNKIVMVGLQRIQDYYPFYSGSFYFFDCDFQCVADSNVEHYVAFSETVCHDIASRMILDGAEKDKVTVVDSDDLSKIFGVLEDIDCDLVYILTNIRSFKAINRYLTKGGNGIE